MLLDTPHSPPAYSAHTHGCSAASDGKAREADDETVGHENGMLKRSAENWARKMKYRRGESRNVLVEIASHAASGYIFLP